VPGTASSVSITSTSGKLNSAMQNTICTGE
jgi:hypothetical protein